MFCLRLSHNYRDCVEKVSVYSFPSDREKRQQWIASFPNKIPLDTVTAYMGVCALHWPEDVPTSRARRSRHYTPAVPPCIFPNVLQPASTSSNPRSTIKATKKSGSVDAFVRDQSRERDRFHTATFQDSAVEKPQGSKKWIELTGQETPEELQKNYVLCAEHFENQHFRNSKRRKLQSKDAIPTVFKPCETLTTELDTDQDVKPILDDKGNLVTDDPHCSASPHDTTHSISHSQRLQPPSPSDLNNTAAVPHHHQSSAPQGEIVREPDEKLECHLRTFVVNMDPSPSLEVQQNPNLREELQEDRSDLDSVGEEVQVSGEEDEASEPDGYDRLVADAKTESHFDIMAKYVISKLWILPSEQRAYAEKLIMDVLFQAELGHLNALSTVDVFSVCSTKTQENGQ